MGAFSLVQWVVTGRHGGISEFAGRPARQGGSSSSRTATSQLAAASWQQQRSGEGAAGRLGLEQPTPTRNRRGAGSSMTVIPPWRHDVMTGWISAMAIESGYSTRV